MKYERSKYAVRFALALLEAEIFTFKVLTPLSSKLVTTRASKGPGKAGKALERLVLPSKLKKTLSHPGLARALGRPKNSLNLPSKLA